MTHDELLENIDLTIKSDKRGTELYWAIRAVVKLHEPSKNEFGKSDGSCSAGCAWFDANDYVTAWGFYSYPCPTIQAIEKELK